jgi:hypothetical protein
VQRCASYHRKKLLDCFDTHLSLLTDWALTGEEVRADVLSSLNARRLEVQWAANAHVETTNSYALYLMSQRPADAVAAAAAVTAAAAPDSEIRQ